MKTILSNKYAVASIVAIAFVGAFFEKVSSFITAGLSSSSSIRVAEQNVCNPSAQKDGAHFTGCNSIL